MPGTTTRKTLPAWRRLTLLGLALSLMLLGLVATPATAAPADQGFTASGTGTDTSGLRELTAGAYALAISYEGDGDVQRVSLTGDFSAHRAYAYRWDAPSSGSVRHVVADRDGTYRATVTADPGVRWTLTATPVAAPSEFVSSATVDGVGPGESTLVPLRAGVYTVDVAYDGNPVNAWFQARLDGMLDAYPAVAFGMEEAETGRINLNVSRDGSYWLAVPQAGPDARWDASITRWDAPAAPATGFTASDVGGTASAPVLLDAGVYVVQASYTGNDDGYPVLTLESPTATPRTHELISELDGPAARTLTSVVAVDAPGVYWVTANRYGGFSWSVEARRLPATGSTSLPWSFTGTATGSSGAIYLAPGRYEAAVTIDRSPANYSLTLNLGSNAIAVGPWEKGTQRTTIDVTAPTIAWFDAHRSDAGSQDLSWSASLARVPQALTAAPKPTITGTAKVGKKLTAKAGTWKPAPVKLAYQWLRNGKAIKGATKATYTLTASDRGTRVSVKVTGSKAGYATASKTSSATGKVAAGTLTATPKPTISGTAKVGKKLTAKAKAWKPAPVKLSYQWLRNGKAIKGATKATYTLAKADRGARITVRVKGSKAGYTTVSKTSSASSRVR
ncbi:MAG: hypothetical protein QM713_06670 [Arachnia sp.]